MNFISDTLDEIKAMSFRKAKLISNFIFDNKILLRFSSRYSI